MSEDDRYARLDELTRELKEVSDVHVVDVGTNGEEVVANFQIGGIDVLALYDEDGDLRVYSDDDRYEDDEVLDHVNSVASEDDVCAVLDEVAWLREQHGDDAVDDYRDRIRGT